VVAHLLARAAAALRADEGRALAALGPEPGSRASQLAAAEALVGAGAPAAAAAGAEAAGAAAGAAPSRPRPPGAAEVAPATHATPATPATPRPPGARRAPPLLTHPPTPAAPAARAGRYREAAAALAAAVEGSMAQPAVAQWVAQARLRALADQSLALLQAHAAAVSASLGPA
jgi:hypothetical protein